MLRGPTTILAAPVLFPWPSAFRLVGPLSSVLDHVFAILERRTHGFGFRPGTFFALANLGQLDKSFAIREQQMVDSTPDLA